MIKLNIWFDSGTKVLTNFGAKIFNLTNSQEVITIMVIVVKFLCTSR